MSFDERLDDIVERSGPLVAAYFDDDGPFSSATFDTLGRTDPDHITEDDLLAVTFLDVRIPPRGVRGLLADPGGLASGLLADVPAALPLWSASDEQVAAAKALRTHLRTFDGVGWVVSSKLLSRASSPRPDRRQRDLEGPGSSR